MISQTSKEMPSLMVHTPSSLEVSPSQFSTHQEPDVSRSATVNKLPISNAWTETNGNPIQTDSEEEEVDVMDITPPKSVNTVSEVASTPSVDSQNEKADLQNEKAEDTETSSGCDLADSDLSGSEKSKIQKKWNKQKYNVSWRWSWLQLQSAELQHQLQQCDASIPPSQPISNNTTNNHNNDATTQPTTSTTQSAPSSPSVPKHQKKQPSIQRHPLFSSKDAKKRMAGLPDTSSVRHNKRLKQFDNDDLTRVKSLSKSTNSFLNPMDTESPITSPRFKRSGSRVDRLNIEHIVLPCTSAPGTPSTPKDVPTPKWRDFGSDPFENYLARSHSMMETTSPCMSPSVRRTKSTNDMNLSRSLSVEFPKEDTQDCSKEIDSQQLTDINTEVKHETLDSVPNENGLPKQVRLLSTSPTFSLIQEGAEVDQKREYHLIRSESGSSLASQTGFKSDGSSSEEDTSDEAFMVRHFCRELLERRRLFKANHHHEGFKCPNDFDELPSMFWQSPEEYFRVKQRCRQSELRSKLKEKFARIKSRYVNPCTIMMDWEKQGVEAERIMAERAHELKQREALLASMHREHREPRVRIIDDDEDEDEEEDEEDEEEHNSYCASSEEEEDFFDQYSQSSEGSAQGLSDEEEMELDEDSDGEYKRYTRRSELTASGRRGRHKKRKRVVRPVHRGRRGRPKQLNQFSPEFGRWEIVRKTPPVDPITNQVRNIIYLRRVREHTQSAD